MYVLEYRVSIPASGIVVFLPMRVPAACCAAITGFHPGERDCGVSTWFSYDDLVAFQVEFPSRRAGLWCFYRVLNVLRI